MPDSAPANFLYETVAGLTGRMLAAARAQDWDQLRSLEAQCAAQLHLLPHPVPALERDARAHKVRLIQQILAHDRAIRDLTMPWMRQLSALLANSDNARQPATIHGKTSAARPGGT